MFYIDISSFHINMHNISFPHWSHVRIDQARSTKLTLQPTRSSDGAQYFAPIAHASPRRPQWHLVNTLKAEQESMSPPDLYIALKCHITPSSTKCLKPSDHLMSDLKYFEPGCLHSWAPRPSRLATNRAPGPTYIKPKTIIGTYRYIYYTYKTYIAK